MRIREFKADPMDRFRYPVDPWRLVETSYSRSDLGTTETLFAVANGYLGMRGNPEGGRPSAEHGTYINGFHETWPIHHAEQAYGFAHTGQTIVNVPDAKLMKIYVDDEPLHLQAAELVEYERSVDFRDGILRRNLVWRTPAGKRVKITSSRMVSMTDRHLAIMTLQVTMLDGDAPVVVSSQILNRQAGRDEYNLDGPASFDNPTPSDKPGPAFDPRKASISDTEVLVPEAHWNSDRRMILGYRTRNSGMTLAVAADHSIDTDNPYEELIHTQPDIGKKVYRLEAKQGVPITITKAVSYHSSRGVPVRELFDRCRRTLDRVRDNGIQAFEIRQREWYDQFWASADVEILGQPELQQATRWCIFQLAQATACANQAGIAAKGVTGSGYEGHYFWDTDIYVVPFLTYTHPQLARNALSYRVGLIPAALRRARELNQNGLLFPWRTINGEEASAYYAAGTAQYHIDADVAYAMMKYADATGDEEFLFDGAADVLVGTARMWADLGFWRDCDNCAAGSDCGQCYKKRAFHIHAVTGPDEYTTVVNNNLFTNVMARANLRNAATLVRHMQDEVPDAFEGLVRRTGVQLDEVEEWERCAQGMVILFNDERGIHPQDEQFLGREVWDLDATPDHLYPLLLNFHPLVIYRFQVVKQADVVLALFLRGNDFTPEEKRADFDYYDPLTTGDSTLSAVVQSIIAAEVGYREKALEYFYAGLYVDLADLHANASDGVHIASAGGVWSALVYGFAGMRDYDGEITFDPRLPNGWDGLNFPLRVRGALVRVQLRADSITFTLEDGDGLTVAVRGASVELQPGVATVVSLADQGPDLTPPVERGSGSYPELVAESLSEGIEPDGLDEM